MGKVVRQGEGRGLVPVAGPGKQEQKKKPERVMKWLERLQNPFALVGQGFFLGGVLFFATHPESLLAAPAPAPAADSVVATFSTAR